MYFANKLELYVFVEHRVIAVEHVIDFDGQL
jgi:hypothetical protein